MASPLTALAQLIDELRELWPTEQTDGLSGDEVARLNEKLGQARRLVDAAHTRIGAEVARRSRPELGPEGLAKVQGYRNPAALIAATTGISAGDAARILQVGEATAPRMTLTGEAAPAKHPHVAAGVAAATIGVPAASAIIRMLDRVAIRAGHEAIDRAEQTLVEQAAGLTLDQLSKLLLRAEAWLDPDGVAPREEELRDDRYLHIREDRTGAIVLNGRFDPAGGAPIKVGIEALVSAWLRAAQDAGDSTDPDQPRRSVPQMQADALTLICEHMLACAHTDQPIGGATVVVRIDLDDLVNGTGHATIDGVDAPISAGTARRIAASADIIPYVLGGDSEILDWGRKRRLFSKTQKLALTERDGGCAGCGAPPGHTKVHHLRWWTRHGGRTDLSNGILLCESCHHRIHDNGWDIHIDGPGIHAAVWFIPPAWVDPDRTPRRGVNRENALVAA